MGTLFEGIDGKDGSFAAIHCNKTICYRLAKAANGGYQAIEEIAANRLRDFASAWDRATDSAGRLRAFTALIEDCFHKKTIVEGEPLDPEDAMLQQAMRDLVPKSEEHTSELQSLMRISYAVFCLTQKKPK